MQALADIFPPTDYTLLLVIAALPLLGAVVNGVFGKRLGPEAVSLMALAAVGGSFALSVVAFLMLHQAQADEIARFSWRGWEWLELSRPRDGGALSVDIAFSLDALSGTMALVVTGVGFLIHLYSTKYMAKDPSYHRFFAYMNLFIFAMLVLVLADNLPVLFIGWEGVGLCSYLLIGFWFKEEKNARAGTKAFIVNRIGDFGLLVAMAMLVYYVGALDWSGLEAGAQRLLRPVQVWPWGADVPAAALLPESWRHAVTEPRYVCGATAVALLLFLGCVGKSAQIPLYVWLPDAMAGPTPVSALIHAATMVTAGVYLVCRTANIFVLSPFAMLVVASVGALTAIFAATIALVQNDIKKVLAYSTISQLGYMFLGVGVGAFAAGFFHVVTHAFFKACLFLGAGSVIHAIHVRIHDSDASQDMRNMGGLRAFLPVTYATFLAAWAAIVAVPLTSGFFSKDEILVKAFTSSVVAPEGGLLRMDHGSFELFTWPAFASRLLFGLGVAGAVLTAFYMTRLVFGIFEGEFRGWTIVHRYKSNEAEHGEADGAAHEAPGPALEGPRPKESPWQMTLPLVVLGALSLGGGLVWVHFGGVRPLEQWLEPVFAGASAHVQTSPDAEALEHKLMVPGFLALALGVGFAYWMYMMRRGAPAAALSGRFPRLYRWACDKWRVDELYQVTVVGVLDAVADLCAWMDKWVVDGIIARLTSALVAMSGAILRMLQTGRVHVYAGFMVVGVAGLGWFFIVPRPATRIDANMATGTYTLTASPGLGYSYRWDEDGDGRFDTEQFGDTNTLKLDLKRNETRHVGLQVKNVIGAVTTEHHELARPPEDLSGAVSTVTIDPSAPPGQRVLGADSSALGRMFDVLPIAPSGRAAPGGAP
ncbi:MAG: NADH-quinone oxidoreductase subunit L [Polyangiaceae bacterium]|nr:NADH-quinone oxidoreductase subunit L [Polyangiaceae bacterium]